jgi:DNA-binding response OmpR family regulator
MARIIIIEDEPDLRELLVEELAYAGHDTLEAGDGVEGLAIIQAEHPEVIIADIGMPLMDGCELRKRLQDCPRLGKTPFLFLTALERHETEHRGVSVAVDNYFTKPVDFDVLLSRIAACAT